MSRRPNPHPPEHLPPGWTSDPMAPSAVPMQADGPGVVHVFLPPLDFLVLTSTPAGNLSWRWEGLREPVAPSWLDIKIKGKDHQVIGHEGRHRADYADRVGVPRLPVTFILRPSHGKYVPIEQVARERSWGWDDVPDYREDVVWQKIEAGRPFFLRTQDYSRGFAVEPGATPSRLVMLSPSRAKGAPPKAYQISRAF